MPATSPPPAKRAPIWLVRRCLFGPNKSQQWRVVGFFRAHDQDEAILKGAHAVKHIAVLDAIEIGPELYLEGGEICCER